MKRTVLVVAVLLLISSSVFADDVSIDSNGNVTTGVSNSNANLEVTGSGEDGIMSTTSGTGKAAVYGGHSSGNYGMLGEEGHGVYGYSPMGWAGYFEGNVNVTGTLNVGGLTGLTEADPIFSGSAASGITSGQITNWDAAYGWGDHSSSGYVTGVTAGTGLTGGGSGGDVTLNVDYSGTGSAGTAARSDHDHNAVYYTQAQMDQIIGALIYEYEARIQSVETLFPRTWKTAAEIGTEKQFDAYSPDVAFDSSGNAVAVWVQFGEESRDNIWANRYTAGIGWGSAVLIETDNAGHAETPQVAVDGGGNAVAVWQQYDGSRYNIWSNRYTAGSGWGTAVLIETDNAGHTHSPQVAVDGSGNAVAVWCQSDGSRDNIWANRYTAGIGWGSAVLIETDNAGHAETPQVAVDGSGNAVAVWRQSDGSRYNIWSNRYTAGSGWGTAVLIETDNLGDAYDPQVAVDGSGNAVAVWQQYDGSRYSIWSNRYTAGSGWATAWLIETNNVGDAGWPQVAVDGSGNAVAVWRQSDGTQYSVWSNRYTAGIGWAAAELIEPAPGNAHSPQVAVDGSGNAVAVWRQWDGSVDNIWSNRYTAGSGWGTAVLIETDDAGDADVPGVAVDGSGNAVAVWHQSDGSRNNIWSNHYTAVSGWAAAELIETDNAGEARTPRVAVDGSGNAVAVWHQWSGSRYSIWYNRYTAVSGWAAAELIETDNAGNAHSPWVAVDGSGNAVAVWCQSDGSRDNIWANRYTAGIGWGTAELIETDNAGHSEAPQVAVDGSGNAVAVWRQSDGSRTNVWANRYTAGSGWAAAELIETDNAGGVVSHQLAVDRSGNAVAVWQQWNMTPYLSNIWANRYTAGSGWAAAELIQTDAYSPSVAVDGSGNAVVVWDLWGDIWSKRYTAGSGWAAAELIETDNAGDAWYPQVAVDRSGNAVAVWKQSDGSRYNIWSNRYTAESGWAAAELIETDDAGDAEAPQVAVDGGGNVVAVWKQSDGSRYNIWSNRYTAGSGWAAAELIETDDAGDAEASQVAVDGGGNAVAVWRQWDGSRWTIYSNEYTRY